MTCICRILFLRSWFLGRGGFLFRRTWFLLFGTYWRILWNVLNYDPRKKRISGWRRSLIAQEEKRVKKAAKRKADKDLQRNVKKKKRTWMQSVYEFRSWIYLFQLKCFQNILEKGAFPLNPLFWICPLMPELAVRKNYLWVYFHKL